MDLEAQVNKQQMKNKLLEYFKGDELAANVWLGKYAQEGDKTPDDMHKRMAKEFARIERNYWLNEPSKHETEDIVDINKLSKYGQSRDKLTEDKIYELFKDFKWIIPQGRVMSGLGVFDSYRSLSNCLRLPPPKDSYSSIMYTDAMLVAAAKRGCGYGLGISNLRPKGVNVKNSANSSTGSVSFMPRYSNSTREVAQDGRRGACLIDININHPDSLDFINSKKDRTQITGANISVKITEEFMKAVENDEDYILRFPCDANIPTGIYPIDRIPYNKIYEYSLNNREDGKTALYKKIKAKEYWNSIIENAWENAEPGVFFWDRVTNYDPCSVYPQFQIDGTNACGEQPMCVYDTCRLILLNLFSYVKNPFTDKAELDEDLLYKYAYEQMRLGDDLVDLEVEYIQRIIDKINLDPEPLEEKQIDLDLWKNIQTIAKEGRRVGCGITALGDMLAALNLKYDSEEALKITEKVMKIKMKAELDCSIDLAILRDTFTGYNFKLEFKDDGLGNYTGMNDFYQFLAVNFKQQVERMSKAGRRNINWSTIAPAGTVSLMTQSTSGCEPLFSPYYFRRKKINPNDAGVRVDFTDQNGDKWQEFPVMHPKFDDWCSMNYDVLDIPYLVQDRTKEDLEKAFKESPWYKSTANDIDWIKRVEMQSILQKYTTSAISTTLNLPNSVTKKEVSDIYFESWKKGLKGQTIYRDGSRTGVLITDNSKPSDKFEYRDAPKRPKSLPCEIHHLKLKGFKYTVLVGLLDSKPYEVFVIPHEVAKEYKTGFLDKQKSGKYNLIVSIDEQLPILLDVAEHMSDTEEALTRLISTSLRHGSDIKFIVEQLNKTKGDLFSFSKSIARVLKKYIPDGVKSTVKCQDCGSSNVIFQEGCQTCQDCGSSKCG